MRYRTLRGVGPGPVKPADSEPVFPLRPKMTATRPGPFFPPPSHDARVERARSEAGVARSNSAHPAAERAAWPTEFDPDSGVRRIPHDRPSAPPGHPLPDDWFIDTLTRDDIIEEEDIDELAERLVPRRHRAREIVGRIFGFAVLIGALYGCGTVLVHPEAGREALDWLTLGHGDEAVGVVREARTAILEFVDRL